MLYLLFVLTFLCGILFYGMSPSDRQLDMTAHQAEGMIATFLAQHQAARDYLYTWLGYSTENDTGNTQNNHFLKAEVGVNNRPTMFNFEQMTPKSITSDMCAGNQGIPGEDSCNDGGSSPEAIPGFVSKVVETGGKYYVITYGGWEKCTDHETGADEGCAYKRPSWWPSQGTRMRRFESWRRAIANRTRGSISCGTLVEVETDKWCIDNGETVYKNESAATKTCMNQLPSDVVNALPSNTGYKDDLLFCMSEFKQGVQPGHYAVTPTYFYDGLANIGEGQHQSKGVTPIDWVSLGTISTSLPAKFQESHPYMVLAGGDGNAVLNTNILLSAASYTVTILAKVSPSTGTFSLFSSQGDAESIFEWEQSWKCDDSAAGFSFKHAREGINDATCFTPYNSGLISWTFVVENCPEDSRYDPHEICMSVYENAVQRSIRKKATFNNNLIIGTADASPGADIYGIRYYGSALKEEQIQKNFKVDQKRFGIADVSNGMTKTELVKGCKQYYSSANDLKEGVTPELIPYFYQYLCSSILANEE